MKVRGYGDRSFELKRAAKPTATLWYEVGLWIKTSAMVTPENAVYQLPKPCTDPESPERQPLR